MAGTLSISLQCIYNLPTQDTSTCPQCMADIDLLRAPTVDVLSRIEYLEEMNVEREARLNQLEEADAKRERRMQELEELLATMKSCSFS